MQRSEREFVCIPATVTGSSLELTAHRIANRKGVRALAQAKMRSFAFGCVVATGENAVNTPVPRSISIEYDSIFLMEGKRTVAVPVRFEPGLRPNPKMAVAPERSAPLPLTFETMRFL